MINGKMILLSGIAIILSLAARAVAESVQALTPDTFDATIGSRPALVEFYAPWCPHCQHLAPVYEQLGEAYSDHDDKVLIAKTDAAQHRDLGQRFGVAGYPTIKWFPQGVNGAAEDYTGARDIDSLTSFVAKASGVKGGSKAPIEVLTDANFDQIVGKTGKGYLVEFYAPWCPHCQALAPTYERVGRDFLNERNVVIAKVNADAEEQLSDKYHIEGYPTIKFFDAQGIAHDYGGDRSERDLVAFVNRRAGTRRLSGGRLTSKAGRNGQLDEIAAKLVKADNPDEKRRLSVEGIKLAKEVKENAEKTAAGGVTPPAASEAAAKPQPAEDQRQAEKAAEHYQEVFAKALESPEYVKTEQQRLKELINSKTGDDKKTSRELDDLSIRHNVLAAFSVSNNESGQRQEL